MQRVDTTVVAEEEPLHPAVVERRDRGDDLVHRGRRGDPLLLEDALAVIEQPRVVDHLDGVDLAVDGVDAKVVRMEVSLHLLGEDVVQRFDLTSLDHGDRRMSFVDVRPLVGQEGGGKQGELVVTGLPDHLDLDIRVDGRVLLGVALRRLLSALFTILVVPLDQLDLVLGGDPGRRTEP